MKPCGECGLCCKLIAVPGLAAAGTWCPHAEPGRSGGCCTIHDDRPQVCLGFNCFWRAESWPDWLRPDRCKVIFEALPGVLTILVSIDPGRADAWQEPKILEVIHKLKNKGRPVVLRSNGRSRMFLPKGWSQARVLQDIKQVLDWQAAKGENK